MKAPAIVILVLLAVVAAEARQATRRSDVRFLPTPDNVVEAMLELARVGPSDVVYDLGSGDGRIPVAAAKNFGAHGVGIEIDGQLVRIAKENAVKAGVADRVTFIQGDLFQADISRASVVTLFLLPSLNIELIPKFRHELRPGARIVSHHFAMGDAWTPDQERDVAGLMIYLWQLPRRHAGPPFRQVAGARRDFVVHSRSRLTRFASGNSKRCYCAKCTAHP